MQRTSFSSGDEAEVTGFITAMYAENSTRFAPVRRGARFSAQTNDTPALGADLVRTSIDYTGTSQQGFSDYVFFLVHAGTVHIDSRLEGHEVSTTAGPRDVAFYPLGVPVAFAMRGFEVSTVRLSAQRLHRVAQEVSGPSAARLRFHALTPVSAGMHRYWRSLLTLASGALVDPASPLASPLLAEDLARTVAGAALRTFPNTTMTQQHTPGPGATAPATVRRAVAHLEENAHRPLQLDEVAAAAGTSARALQYGFRQHLGTTPTGYLRRVRLERAHRELQAADPTGGASVAAIAARWGFANAGRFASAYREVYGVRPGTTLRT
ncbi:helix-turn-helix domain-containing protein [Kineococcus sp. SYSU DK005]|uniref:helix-turn-helix domain-containing protein n=1 Tax=Kineococcus sp. SYSU DK005 TaxID=3383126 RepID=UPI003D7EFCE2